MCDEGSYRGRMWCRAEQLSYLLRNGSEDMYLAQRVGECRLIDVQLGDALRVFDGAASRESDRQARASE